MKTYEGVAKAMRGEILFATSGDQDFQENFATFNQIDSLPKLQIMVPVEGGAKKYRYGEDLSELTASKMERFVRDY